MPMVGFGFMVRAQTLREPSASCGLGLQDNLVMIQAGDMIDNSIGVTFGNNKARIVVSSSPVVY